MALACLAVAYEVSLHLYDPSADPRQLGTFLCAVPGILALMFLIVSLALMVTCSWPIYGDLISQTSRVARKWYGTDPAKFYAMSEAELKVGAETILTYYAGCVLQLEQSTRNEFLMFQGMLKAVRDTEQKRREFESAYDDLKTTGLIEDVGYGHYYHLAKSGVNVR